MRSTLAPSTLSAFSPPSSNPISSVRSSPSFETATETIPVNYGGEPLEIGFNPQFLQDGLEAVEVDEVLLKLISPLRPGLIEAGEAEGDQAKDRFLYLIMPVRLNV